MTSKLPDAKLCLILKVMVSMEVVPSEAEAVMTEIIMLVGMVVLVEDTEMVEMTEEVVVTTVVTRSREITAVKTTAQLASTMMMSISCNPSRMIHHSITKWISQEGISTVTLLEMNLMKEVLTVGKDTIRIEMKERAPLILTILWLKTTTISLTAINLGTTISSQRMISTRNSLSNQVPHCTSPI